MTTRDAAPLVGVTMCLDDGSSFGSRSAYAYLKREYLVAVRAAGGIPLLLTPDVAPADVLGTCAGLVVTGGADVPPSDYGAVVEPDTVCESRERVDWERRLIDALIAAGRPILGICYGMQLLNVHFGGTLCQRRTATEPAVDHGSPERPTRHVVAVDARARLARVLAPSTMVSSAHRQSIGALAPGLAAAATAPDGSIEALERDGVLGVAWHPERDGTGAAIYCAFIAECRARSTEAS
jgi:gamma-glutamyl-gamma-aminobutyrate hydrolase PuuD